MTAKGPVFKILLKNVHVQENVFQVLKGKIHYYFSTIYLAALVD